MFFFYLILALTVKASEISLERYAPQLFSEVAAEATEKGTQKNIDDIHTLIATSDYEIAVAKRNLTNAHNDYLAAYAIWKKAFDEKEVALTNKRNAEIAEKKAEQAVADAEAFVVRRQNEKKTADARVPVAKKFMENEIARVKAEHETLNKVKSILEGIISTSLIQIPSNKRNLLSKTTSLLADPNFLEMLRKANPTAVRQVIDMVVALINKGTAEVKYATSEYNARVAEAKTAAQNLSDAEVALAQRRDELASAIAHRQEMTKIAKAKCAVELAKRQIRDRLHTRYLIQKEFTERELARLAKEKRILLEGIRIEHLLKEVVVALQEK